MDEVGKLAAGQQGGTPYVDAVQQQITPGDIQGTDGSVLSGIDPQASTTAASINESVVTTLPTRPDSDVGQVAATTQIAPDVAPMTAAQIEDARRPQIDISQVEGTVSAGSQAVAATQELDPRGTVQYQLSELLGSIEEGKPMPAWAAPAVRKVAGVMQARGLGASSMAAAAMTQAVMESGIVIAAQDANKYATIQLQN